MLSLLTIKGQNSQTSFSALLELIQTKVEMLEFRVV